MLELNKIINIFCIDEAYMNELVFDNRSPLCGKCVIMFNRRCKIKGVYPEKAYCMTKIW